MVAAPHIVARDIPLGEYVPAAEERIVLQRVPWSHFEAELAVRGDASSRGFRNSTGG